jgi:hypothetical protein
MSFTGWQKNCAVLVILVVCTTIMGAFFCQIHDTSSAHAHAMPSSHHQPSSTHAVGGCMGLIAVLPMGTSLLLFRSWLLALHPIPEHSFLFVFLLHRPPRPVVSSMSVS